MATTTRHLQPEDNSRVKSSASKRSLLYIADTPSRLFANSQPASLGFQQIHKRAQIRLQLTDWSPIIPSITQALAKEACGTAVGYAINNPRKQPI
jgi:hypothetical protein